MSSLDRGAARAMTTTRADAIRPFQVEGGRTAPTPTASREKRTYGRYRPCTTALREAASCGL